MKRYGNLWHSLIAFDNLLLAWRKARKGKTQKAAVAEFALNLERELFNLQYQLQQQTWQPSPYRLFTIYERKPRQIAAAPFRDRVVHHALMNIIDPLLDKTFIYDSYACRIGKGVHQAVNRYQHWSQRYAYVLKLDVSRYFPSIDHAILKQLLRRKIKDKKVLWLFDQIIEQAPRYPIQAVYFPNDDLLTPLERRVGLPIGNLTSQFLANLYLDGLDHTIKEDLRVKAYLRYVDDLFLLSNDKQRLHDWQQQIQQYLQRLRLCLHPAKINLFRVNEGIDVLGYRVFPSHRLLRNDNGYRFARRLRQFATEYEKGRLEWADFNPSVQSWIGHASQANTLGLREAIFSATVFTRASGISLNPSCVARRFLEQQTEQLAFGESQQQQSR